MGINRIDHAAVRVGDLGKALAWYEDVLEFTLFKHFDDKDISTEYSALMSKVMASGGGLIMSAADVELHRFLFNRLSFAAGVVMLFYETWHAVPVLLPHAVLSWLSFSDQVCVLQPFWSSVRPAKCTSTVSAGRREQRIPNRRHPGTGRPSAARPEAPTPAWRRTSHCVTRAGRGRAPQASMS